MLTRFCLYSVLKNLRFADPFLVLFLLDINFSYTGIGLLLGFERLLSGLLEVPTGILADRWGRRSSLAACFLFYTVSFLVFAHTAGLSGAQQTVWLYAAATLFSLGEALRTGSHKAIILDWLDARGESGRTTRVIGIARTFSKASSGMAALVGGLVLYFTGGYRALFQLSAVAAVAGFVLMLTYPRELEGEQWREPTRATGSPRPSLLRRLAVLAAAPGILPLFFHSVVFESQTHLLLKYYLQPFLREGLEARGILIMGAGALWVGANEAVRDGLGGLGAWLSPTIERSSGGGIPALRRSYRLCLVLSLSLGLCYYQGWLLGGLAVLALLTMLQNARRPLFISAFNRVMDRPQRATTLSIESQSRSLATAALLPLMGVLADHLSLGAVFLAVSAILAAGLLIPLKRGPATL
ncbi:MAG: MFS transporter [Acidobacteria bacterium]|nr:MAG: MFS transporter [Acidobacteriota bacterium]